MAARSPLLTARVLGLLLAGAVFFFASPGLTASPSPEQEKKESKKESDAEGPDASDKDAAKKKTTPVTKKKPRVFSNADLAKYAKKPATPAQPQGVRPSIAPADPVSPEGRSPRITVPADDLENASVPDLEARRQELTELVSFLEKKVAWLKNPFLPRPEPPYGEELLDPSLSGGQEYQLSRSRIVTVRGRLQKVERLLSAANTP